MVRGPSVRGLAPTRWEWDQLRASWDVCDAYYEMRSRGLDVVRKPRTSERVAGSTPRQEHEGLCEPVVAYGHGYHLGRPAPLSGRAA
jgi:hypothetical protein